MDKIRLAAIGTGWIAKDFVRACQATGCYELCAVYSRKEATGLAFGEEFGCRTVFTDLAALAASDLVDAVYVASPNSLHYVQSKVMLEGGKHVICEKPVTVWPEEFSELCCLAEERGLVYLEALMYMHMPLRKSFLSAIEELGTVRLARFDFSQLSSKYKSYLEGGRPNIFNPEFATGALMDLGVYCIYPAVDAFGVPKGVCGSAAFLEPQADAVGSAILTYDDKIVVLTYDKTGAGGLGSEVIGDKGTLTIGSVSRLSDMKISYPGKTEVKVISPPPEEAEPPMYGEAAAFARFILHGTDGSDEYARAHGMSLAVSQIMAKLRSQCGIVFPSQP